MKFVGLKWMNPSRFVVAMAALLALLFAWPHSAQAQIIYTPVNVQILDDSYGLDVNNDGVTDFTITSFIQKYCDCHSGGCWTEDYIREFPASGNGVVGSPPFALELGQEIGPKQTFYEGTGDLVYYSSSCSGGHISVGRWRSAKGKTAYLGLSFQINAKHTTGGRN